MNCVLYARVSTGKQAEKDLSIPAQLTLMREYAQRQGWTVIDEFTEPGATATSMIGRPVLRGIIDRISRNELRIDTVIAHKLNRMARNLEDYVPLRALLAKHGVRLTYVVEKVDDTPSGRLLENVMASIAQFESANLSEETKKGMRQKALTGGWPHKPPRGYVTVSGTPHSRVDIHPRLGSVVRRAFELYATGQYSIESVAIRLAPEGLLSRNGRRVSTAELHRMLTNVFYVGRVKWQDLNVQGAHPKLVSQELFEAVQAVIAARHKVKKRRGSAGLPLRGMAICASCRGNMTGEWHGRWAYYRCCRKTYQRELCDARLCNADKAHADLQSTFARMELPTAIVDKIKKAAARVIGERTARSRRDEVLEQEEALLAERAALTGAFVAGQISPANYQDRGGTLNERARRLERSRGGSADPKLLLSRAHYSIELATTLWDLYDSFSSTRRVELLHTVLQSVVLNKDGIVGVVFKPPFDKLHVSAGSYETWTPGKIDEVARSVVDAAA